MNIRKIKSSLGFTLVELLIVIALLGIIALIVIAAINPIEQANRARDTGMRADGAQLLSAIDRYFAIRQDFPWVTQSTTGASNDDAFGYVSAGTYTVGLCADGGLGVDNCDANGVLIVDEELKPEFRNRKFIDAHVATPQDIQDLLVLGKEDQVQSAYVCYIPMSKSNRTEACDESNVWTALTGTGTRTNYDCSTTQPTDWVGSTIALSYYVCVPE